MNYVYDVMGRRIAKTVDVDGEGSEEATTTHFVYDGNNVLMEFEDDNITPSQRYLHGPQIDQVLAQDDGTGQPQWLLADHLGTIYDVIDNSGIVLNHITFDSYGNVLNQTDDTFSTRYLFTGREFDTETGLYYYRARYYNSEIGQFISQDPIGFSGDDSNLYRYVENNPVNMTDPTGLFKVELYYRPFAASFHADIVVSYEGDSYVYWAGPENPVFSGGVQGIINGVFFGGAGKLVASVPEEPVRFVEGEFPFYSSAIQSTPTLIYDDGTDCANDFIESKITDGLSNIHNLRLDYSISGPNSNTAARYALLNAGLIDYSYHPSGVTLPGWFNTSDELNPGLTPEQILDFTNGNPPYNPYNPPHPDDLFNQM
ncbi:MAG: RHS repeat-associated core domain-containing protein [Symploca sp. SIO3C6]|nr:RHS repeat-associated core domain-containing protein [Symploca sp. SIO3C6]